MSCPKKTKLDVPTLLALLKEAEEGMDAARERFEEYDNVEDMHAMDSWECTADWLRSKLP